MTTLAHTAFANGLNAWTGQRQTTPRKTMKKPVSGVDGLTVDHDIPLPEHKVMPGNKYGDLFAKLKPKSSIGCEPADVGRLQNALRKWLETNNKADKFVVRSTKSDHQGKGRVWLWPKGEK